MTEPAPTPELLAALSRGEAGARDGLLVAWGPTVLRWCLRLGQPGIDAEDAAHDVFERLLARVHTLRTPEAFPAWLYQTTRRVVRGHRRRAWLRRWVAGAPVEAPDPRPDPARSAASAQEARAVRAALSALPEALREILVLCELEERDGPEVAAFLNLPLGTVKSRLRRARAAFEREARRRGLAPDEEEP